MEEEKKVNKVVNNNNNNNETAKDYWGNIVENNLNKDDFLKSKEEVDRLLYRKDLKQYVGDSVEQTMTVKENRNSFPNPNQPIYYKTTDFPQPAIIGCGEFTGASTVSKDPTLVFQPNWTLSRIGTGVYRITHNLGHKKYLVFTQISSSSLQTVFTYVSKENNYFQIETNSGGTRLDAGLKIEFIVFTIL